jgi:hypothetical protein
MTPVAPFRAREAREEPFFASPIAEGQEIPFAPPRKGAPFCGRGGKPQPGRTGPKSQSCKGCLHESPGIQTQTSGGFPD